MSTSASFIKPDWVAPTHVKAFTTLRQTWGKNGLCFENKIEREHQTQLLTNLLQLPTPPIWLKQTHGTKLIEALAHNQFNEADASFASQAQQVCVVLTADCLPILLFHQHYPLVAAIHAGWRGLANGIIELTIEKLSCQFFKKKDSENNFFKIQAGWTAWLGPAISAKHFVVGSDVYHSFVDKELELKNYFSTLDQGKWLADLYAIARYKLNKLNITHIYGGQYCTYSQDDLFFSYRRDPGCRGRMASIIWMQNNS